MKMNQTVNQTFKMIIKKIKNGTQSFNLAIPLNNLIITKKIGRIHIKEWIIIFQIKTEAIKIKILAENSKISLAKGINKTEIIILKME